MSAVGGTAVPGPRDGTEAAAPNEARNAITASPLGVHTGSAHNAGESDRRSGTPPTALAFQR